jgi:hypothetical protein
MATVNDRSSTTHYRGNSALGMAAPRHFAGMGNELYSQHLAYMCWLSKTEPRQEENLLNLPNPALRVH